MNTKKWKFLLTLTLLSLALTACAGAGASLEGTAWKLVEFAGQPFVANTQPTISFEDGRVGGNSSCNTYGGEYTVNGDNVEFGMLMSTMMACADNNAMAQEQEYLAFLSSVKTWELRNGQLLFFDANGNTLIFEPQS